MTIEFRCAQCNQLLRVPDTSAGKNARCPKCQLLMQIPAASPANIPPPPLNFAPPPPTNVAPTPRAAVPPPPANFFPPPHAQAAYAPQQPGFPAPEPNPFDFASGSRKSSSRSGVHQQGPAAGSSANLFAGMPGAGPVPGPPPPPPPPAPPANPFDFAASSGSSSSRSSSSSYGSSKSRSSKGPRQGLPWESGKTKGFAAFMDTAKLVAFEPGRAFSQMLQNGDMGQPMLYSGLGMAIGLAGMVVWVLVAVLLFGTSLGVPPEFTLIFMIYIMMVSAGYFVIGVPLAATLGNMIQGGVLHICLAICGGSKQPFDTSFRIACYVSGSLLWICWIPGGLFVIGIWQLASTIIAVHKAHEVPMGKAALAVLLPLILGIALSVFMSLFMCGGVAALMPRGR